jgi:hypothetical protein
MDMSISHHSFHLPLKAVHELICLFLGKYSCEYNLERNVNEKLLQNLQVNVDCDMLLSIFGNNVNSQRDWQCQTFEGTRQMWKLSFSQLLPRFHYNI